MTTRVIFARQICRLGPENTTLDATDRLGIQILHGRTPGATVGMGNKAAADISPLIQAMAGFDTNTRAANSVLREVPTGQRIALGISPQLPRRSTRGSRRGIAPFSSPPSERTQPKKQDRKRRASSPEEEIFEECAVRICRR